MTLSASRTDHEPLDRIRDEILRRQRFLITSHLKPDGDSIGSQMAMAYALRALGKDVRLVNCDPAQPAILTFPGVSQIEVASQECYCPVEVALLPGARHSPQRDAPAATLAAIAGFVARVLASEASAA